MAEVSSKYEDWIDKRLDILDKLDDIAIPVNLPGYNVDGEAALVAMARDFPFFPAIYVACPWLCWLTVNHACEWEGHAEQPDLIKMKWVSAGRSEVVFVPNDYERICTKNFGMMGTAAVIRVRY